MATEGTGSKIEGAAISEIEKKAPTPDETCSYFKLYSQADRFDCVLIILGTLGALCNGAAWPMFAIIFAQFTSVFGDPTVNFMANVNQVALYFLYLSLAACAAAFLQASMWMWTGHRQTSRIRQLYLQAVLRQNVEFFDTQATTGSLLEGLNEDGNAVQQAISEKVGDFLQHTATFAVGYAIAFWRGWDMTLVMVGTLPFLAGVGAILAKLSTYTAAKSSAAYVEASSLAQQSISQIRTVVSFHREEQAIESYREALTTPLAVGIQQGLVVGVCNGGVQTIVYWTYALAFIYGAWRISVGAMDGGAVLNVFVAALIGGFSAGQAAPVLANFARGRVAGYKLFKVIERIPPIDDANESGLIPPTGETCCQGALELKDLEFTYPARLDTKVFREFSLVVPAGKTVALVGSSGSGKSTAIQLIERFYDPQVGQVLLDGVDIRTLNLKWLRSQIGLVSQEPTLFATTIYENILMGRPGASEEEVKAAAQAANASRFIANLPLKMSTQVGERGLSLSGGQKQRIAIARAILKNPRIMLLDEATSALDTQSERIVQDALNKMIVGRTTVVVAHRLSTIRDADMIAVVSNGRVVELGSHSELIDTPNGVYTALVRLQMKTGGAGAGGDKKVEGKAQVVEEEVEEGDPDEILQGGWVPEPSRDLFPKEVKKQSLDIKARGSPVGGDGGKGALKEGLVDGKDKEDKVDVKPKANVPFSRLIAYNKPEVWWILTGFIGAAMCGVVQPSFAFVISDLITTLFAPKDVIMSKISFLCWMFFVIGCGVFIGALLMYYSFGICGQRLSYRLRVALYRNILHQEIGFFDLDANSSGALTTRLSSDASQVRGAVGDTLALLLQNGVCLAFGFLIAFVYNWRMALLVLGALPIMISGSIIYYQRVMGAESGSESLFASANQAVSDAFSSIRVIHAYGLRQQVCDVYLGLLSSVNSTIRSRSLVTGALFGYSQFSLFSVYGLIIWFGGMDVDAGRSDFNSMLKAFLAVLLAAMGLAQAQAGFPDAGKAKAAIQSLFPILDRKSLIDASDPKGVTPDDFKGEIELQEVSFVYPARPSVNVFVNFNLVIPAGKTAALVGESGSGKSTVVGLIERFYDVAEGSVLIDGINIKDYSLPWLRNHIGLVSQEPLLFSSSILSNIRYGAPDATMAQVEEAARAANAFDFISALPDGFNTLVGERGMQLSGGQKQRVAIARAILKNPKIMLLDEATSALDARAEKEVQVALDKIMVGRTSVVIAHRLSTIRNADMIALVFRGAILEQGTHDDLMGLNGGYAKLVQAQLGAASPDNE